MTLPDDQVASRSKTYLNRHSHPDKIITSIGVEEFTFKDVYRQIDKMTPAGKKLIEIARTYMENNVDADLDDFFQPPKRI